MRILLLNLLLLLPCLAADKDFNGRWDITVHDSARKRAWWLEVKGAGTPTISGSFVGAAGGQMDKIPEIKIADGGLEFTFKSVPNRGTGVYRAKLVQGKLEGTLEGVPVPLKWTGVRAPKLSGGDPKKWHDGKPVELFNGKDLTGWTLLHPEKKKGWNVANGIAKNEAGASDLVSTEKFWNFKLHAEFRLGPKSNSGIGLRGRYEVQLYDDYGEPPSLHGNGALYSRIVPVINASKPAGEWQTYDVTLIGNEVTVVLNQAKIIDRGQIDGLTAIAADPNESEPGPIIIQGDHGSVEFRKITITPLEKGKPKS